MASTTAANSLKARAKRTLNSILAGDTNKNVIDLVPGSSDKCIPLARLKRVLFGLMLGAPSATPIGGITEFEVIASTNAAGTGSATVVQAATAFSTHAEKDTQWLEVSAEEIQEVLPTAAYVGVRAKFADAQDQATIYVEQHLKDAYSGLTADYDA